jgi:hypothetical protein
MIGCDTRFIKETGTGSFVAERTAPPVPPRIAACPPASIGGRMA